MYKFTGFSEKANLALNNAVNCAEDMGHTYVGSEHILAGLLKDPTSVAGIVLQSRRVTYNGFYDKIRGSVGIGVPTELTVRLFFPTNISKKMPMTRAMGARLSDLKKYSRLLLPALTSIRRMIWAVMAVPTFAPNTIPMD